MNKRLNKYYNKVIELKEGEEFCKKCDGTGLVQLSSKITQIYKIKPLKMLICSTCLGEGKLDWVEKISGKSR